MSTSVKEMLFWSKCAAFAAGATYLCWRNDVFAGLQISDMRSAAGVVSQLSGTMLGFVLAALAILTSVENTALMRNMQRTGHLPLLLRRMLICIVAFGLATAGGTAMLFLPKPTLTHAHILIGASLFSAALLADVCRKFWMVLTHLGGRTP